MSESLIAATKQLAELEKARDADHDCTIFAFLEQLQATAPKMLEVLSHFQAGDVDIISDLLKEEKDLLEWYKADSAESGENYDERIEGMEAKIDCLTRLQKAASLMEAEDAP